MLINNSEVRKLRRKKRDHNPHKSNTTIITAQRKNNKSLNSNQSTTKQNSRVKKKIRVRLKMPLNKFKKVETFNNKKMKVNNGAPVEEEVAEAAEAVVEIDPIELSTEEEESTEAEAAEVVITETPMLMMMDLLLSRKRPMNLTEVEVAEVAEEVAEAIEAAKEVLTEVAEEKAEAATEVEAKAEAEVTTRIDHGLKMVREDLTKPEEEVNPEDRKSSQYRQHQQETLKHNNEAFFMFLQNKHFCN